MKPESIKCILKSYLKERQHTSSYSDVAGFLHEPPEYITDVGDLFFASSMELPVAQAGWDRLVAEADCGHAGKTFYWMDDRPDLSNLFQPQSAALPLTELNVSVEPHLEALAAGVGHQLNEMVNDFEANRVHVVNNQAAANGNRTVRFKECVIRVSPTSDRVQIPVIRANAAGGEVNATWRTCDKSAEAGVHYVNGQGSISFARGEEEKTIEIEILRGQDRRNDLHFAVELFDAEGTFNALMVHIVDDSRLYPEENWCIQNIFNCAHNISMSEIVSCLRDNVTRNTFKAGLLCISSYANSMPSKELALGAELWRLTSAFASLGTLTNVFCEFGSYLPELEDIVSMS